MASQSTAWIDPLNWTPNGLPSDLADIIIPDATTTPNDPLMPTDSTAVGRMTIQNLGILNATSSTIVKVSGGSGAWSNDGGTFNASTSTVIFGSPIATISGSTDFYNVIIKTGAALTMGTNDIMRIAGTMTNNGTWRASQNANNTVEYNGADQTVLNPNGLTPGYDDLILSGTGTKTMPGTALSIAEDFTMSGSASATALAAMTISGFFDLESGTTFTTGALSHSIGGDFINNGGTFIATGSTITLNGSVAQTIGGTTSSTFNNLTLNNAAGASLEKNETVGGTLVFTSGKITTAANSLIISNAATGAITGASSSKYVIGHLQLAIAAGVNTYNFPLGTAMGYAPVEIAFTAGTTAGDLTGTTFDGDHPNLNTSTLTSSASVNRYWNFTINSGLTTANYSATFNWVAGDEDTNFENVDPSPSVSVGKYTAGSWIYPAIGTTSESSIQITGASGFSDFAVALNCTAYTATLTGATTICTGGSADLSVDFSDGTAPWTFHYNDGADHEVTTSADPYTLTVSPGSNTTYSITSVVDNNSCAGTVAGSSQTVTVVIDPIAPTVNVVIPASGTIVCVGQDVSATMNAGSGGTGCTDEYQYSTNGGSSYTPYTSGSAISTIGLVGQSILIQIRRNCTGNGCDGVAETFETVASWTVVADPTAPSLNIATPASGTTVCVGQDVSATMNAGSGGTGCTDEYQYSTNSGSSYAAYIPGSAIPTIGLGGQSVIIQTRRNCSGNGCDGGAETFATVASWTVVSDPTASDPASQTTCDGETATLSVSPSGGTGTFHYQWQQMDASCTSPSNVGGDSPSYMTAALSTGTYYYRVIISQDGNGCGTVTTGCATVSVIVTGQWLGTTNTDWFTASNWCGGVPTSATDVFIPSGGNQPDISASGAVCHNITIGAGATLSITGTFTLTVSGSWTNTGTFTAGTSTVDFNGSGGASIGASNFNNITFSGSGTKTATGVLTIGGNVSITDNFTAGSFIHTVAGNWTNSGAFTSTGSTVAFNGTSSQAMSGASTTTFNNFTISNITGVTSSSDINVNGILSLTTNPSATAGSLDMGTNTLTMGVSATSTGAGDVTGIVTRNSLMAATTYSFGNQFNTITFQNAGTLPTSVSVRISIGAAPLWKTGAINRIYEIIQAGASGSFATINVHYLDTELNGNTENNLVFWRAVSPFTPGTELEFGRSNFNTTQNWVGISSIPVGNLPTSFGTAQATLGTSLLSGTTWNGSQSTAWIDPLNWTPNGVPSDLADIIIPDATTTPNDPLMPTDSTAVGRMTIQNLGILNATSSTIVKVSGGSGAWSNDGGTFNASTSTVIFSSPVATISGSTDFYNVIIKTGAALTMGSNDIMRIAGTMTNNGTWQAAQNANNIVEYNGGDQTVLNPNGGSSGYDHLILSGTGTKTMPGTALTITKNFVMAGIASATAGEAMTIGDSLTLGSGTTFITGAFSHTVGGRITNNGATFTTTGSTITLNGSTQQPIGGTSSSIFNNLTLNNAAGASLEIDETVSGTFVFTSGKITTAANSLIISNPATGAITGASSSDYVIGHLQRAIAAGVNTYAFPLGTAMGYAPVDISFTSGTTAGNLTGTTFDGDHPSIGTSTLDANRSVNQYWRFLINSGLATADYGATFYWDPADEDVLFDYTMASVSKFDSPIWTPQTVATQNPNNIVISGASGFSDLQVAEDCVDPDVPTIGVAETSGTTDDDGIICDGDMATLSITGGVLNGATDWEWYTVDCGDTPAGTGSSIMVSPSVMTTYYVRGEGGVLPRELVHQSRSQSIPCPTLPT